MAGFGTHFVPSSRIPALLLRLSELQSSDISHVAEAVDEFSGTFTKSQHANWSLGPRMRVINRCFGHASIPQIVFALEAESVKEGPDAEFAREALQLMRGMSPTSMFVTLELLRRGSKMSLFQCLSLEFRLAQAFLVRRQELMRAETSRLCRGRPGKTD